MTDLPHVIAGRPLSHVTSTYCLPNAHIQVFEVYCRERNWPAGPIYGTADVNAAVDWWNALGTDVKSS